MEKGASVSVSRGDAVALIYFDEAAASAGYRSVVAPPTLYSFKSRERFACVDELLDAQDRSK